MTSNISEWPRIISEATKDKGFSVILLILKRIIGNSDVLFFFIIAAFQILAVALICRKYSSDYWMSIFLFIATSAVCSK